MATDTLQAEIDEIMPGVIADRRYLHTIPELGLQEFKTSAYVLERLRSLPVESICTGIAVTGITALLHGTKPSSKPGKVVMLRADMDGLPILEENDVEYKSQSDGAMHACGHDGHTARLLGIARLLTDRRDQFSGTVKLLFQPAEEGPGGAKPMIEQGVLENPYVDAVFGMHVAQDLAVGKVELRPGPAMAASDRFYVQIQGKGGHGASPHLTIDAVTVAAHVLTTLQTIVSREVDPIDPAVVTVGMIKAGEAPNVIPDTAEMRGTVRTFNPNTRQRLAERIPQIIAGVAKGLGASANVRYELRYPSAHNDPAITA